MYEDERWMPIVDFEGHFEVSDHGRVRSLGRFKIGKDGRRIITPGKILKTALNSEGYPCVLLQRKHLKRTIKVANEVARSFLGDPGEFWVLHNDGDSTNSHLSNLRYGTRRDNCLDSVAHGTHNMARTHCSQGHAFTPENTAYVGARKKRECRTCQRDRLAARRAKYKADQLATMGAQLIERLHH